MQSLRLAAKRILENIYFIQLKKEQDKKFYNYMKTGHTKESMEYTKTLLLFGVQNNG